MTKAERVANTIGVEISVGIAARERIAEILEREYPEVKFQKLPRFTGPIKLVTGETLTPVKIDVPRPANAPPDVMS